MKFNLSKEHKLAFKIAIILFFFAIFISYMIPYIYHISENYSRDIKKWWMWGYNKYIIFIVLSFFIYFVSYYLAKITIKPIEKHNENLKEYNHNLAHELKTPISVIKSNLELLEFWFDKKLIESSAEELDYMSNIINSLLFLSNSNSSKINNKEKINLEEIIIDNINKWKWNIILINSNNKSKLLWNRELINSLIRNLLDNAYKYWKEWKKIKIELTSKFLIIKNKLNKDIKKDDLEKIFNTFYQIDDSRYSKGYGLWLSIVKKICNIHNLDIKIDTLWDDFVVKITF